MKNQKHFFFLVYVSLLAIILQYAETQDFPMMHLTDYSCPTQDGSTCLSCPAWVSVLSMIAGLSGLGPAGFFSSTQK